MTGSSKKRLKAQPKSMIFALDIGTRSIIGIVGTVEGERLRVIATEKEEHTQRAMIDGQIEDIEQVAKVALIVKTRLEEKLRCKLKRVCVAAAGRALRTQRASYEMKFPHPRLLDDEIISRLEAGAIGEAEAAFTRELDSDSRSLFYLVGHTVVQYYMDHYPISSLLEHQARQIQADVIATFLPSEVVESLYATMHRISLEVVSLTLEPIAAINVAIPQSLRLLNLALVDIGAGTSDIAVCRDGGVVGYTIVTVAGDEITEALMKNFLLDFNTAESVKTQLGSQKSVSFTDILGIEQTITQEDMMACIEESAENLCREISEHICDVNGGPPSAVFLAGGGSKLASMRACIARHLNMDINRVAIAGGNFQTYAFSDTYDLNDPEYATPLGIAISTGLNLISESFHVTLNGSRAKLFRSSTITVLDILMMNGYSNHDLLPRAGQRLTIRLNGKQTVYYGVPGEPADLRINGREAKISDQVHAGDSIEFTPAVQGQPARRCVKDLLTGGTDQTVTVNGSPASPEMSLKAGDVVTIEASGVSAPETGTPASAVKLSAAPVLSGLNDAPPTESGKETAAVRKSEPSEEKPPSSPKPSAPPPAGGSVVFILNGRTVALPGKPGGAPYLLMEMLERSGIDLDHPTGELALRVNGVDSSFSQSLKSGDRLEIFFRTRS